MLYLVCLYVQFEDESLKAKQKANLKICFKNPFDVKLTDVVVCFDGAIRQRHRKIKLGFVLLRDIQLVCVPE